MADIADIRRSNLFREGHGDSNHLNILALREYNRTDLAILVLVVLITILVNKYLLTRR